MVFILMCVDCVLASPRIAQDDPGRQTPFPRWFCHTEPLQEFNETEAELVDPYGFLRAKELAYFQMGEAGRSNAPHDNNNDKDDDDKSDDGEEEEFLFTVAIYWLLSAFRFHSCLMLWNISRLLFTWF
jgi:hypothetical protein